MANVKISELLLFTPVLTDEIIVNDVDVLVTKRATLQSIRDLANENIDDTATGSEVTGDLNVTGDITSDTINGVPIAEYITEDELDAILGENETLLCVRDSADDTCGVALLGETRVDSDLIVRGNIIGDGNLDLAGNLTVTGNIESTSGIFTGDGSGLINVKADSAQNAAKALFAIVSTYADSAGIADSAERSRISIEANWSSEQRVVNINTDATYYPTFVGTTAGIDSVNTDTDLTYNPSSNILTAGFFSGDGSLLTNITADGADANQVNAVTTTVDAEHYVMFRFNATGLDSVNTDGDLRYNPNTNRLGGTDSDNLEFFGIARTAQQTDANAAPSSGTYYPMLRGAQTGRDSVSTETNLSFNLGSSTLNSTNFAGNGYYLTNIGADSAVVAQTSKITAATDNSEYYLTFSPATSGSQSLSVDANLRINPGTNDLSFSVADARVTVGADSDFVITQSGTQYSFNVTNNGSSAYTFGDTASVFFPTDSDNPVLFLRRGDTYRFDLNASGHPFEIRLSDGGSAYTTGVTNASSNGVGQVFFAVSMNAPSTLYYQCTAHSAMGNTINVV